MALRAGTPRSYAARIVGIAPNTFLEWLARGQGRGDRPWTAEYAMFAKEVEQAENDAIVALVANMNLLSRKDFRAAHYLLRLKDRETFDVPEKVELQGGDEEKPIRTTLRIIRARPATIEGGEEIEG